MYIFGLYVCLHQPIKCQCCSHIETSQLICTVNQLTGFYMRATLALDGLKKVYFFISLRRFPSTIKYFAKFKN